jgi:Flp pilus assembly protein TadG
MDGQQRAGEAGILRDQSGQSLVELALIAPILLILLIGLVEMGRYAYISILVGNAAHAGVSYAAQSLPQSMDLNGITTAADNDFQNNGQPVGNLIVSPPVTACGCDSDGTIASASSCTGNGAGVCITGQWVVTVSVTASGTFNPLFGYTQPLFGYLAIQPINLSSTATERVAQR